MQILTNLILKNLFIDPKRMKLRLTSMRRMMERMLERPEVEEEAKKTVKKALEQISKEGLTYREAMAIQRRAYEAIGFFARNEKLEGVEEVMVPGERGDKIRSKILDSDEIEVEDNLLNSLKSFVEGN